MRWGIKGIWLRVISGEREWMLRLKMCNKHMAHAETAYFRKHSACVIQSDGSYEDFEFWDREVFSFCLDEESSPQSCGYAGYESFGGGRLDCCDDSSILAKEGVALCRALTEGMPLWAGYKAATWEARTE